MPEPHVPYQYIQDLHHSLGQVPPESIISRTVYEDAQTKAILFGFAPGQELSEHTATHPAVLHFVSGEADLTLGGQAHPAIPGTWAHMDAGLPHSIKARTPLTMLLLLLK